SWQGARPDRIQALTHGIAALCTPATARPEGSAAAANVASHSIAAGDEHAIDLPPGTVRAQASPWKWRSNRLRYQYASFVAGGLTGYRVAASTSWASVTVVSACALRPSIQPYPTPSLNCSFCRQSISSGSTPS